MQQFNEKTKMKNNFEVSKIVINLHQKYLIMILQFDSGTKKSMYEIRKWLWILLHKHTHTKHWT
jgi:hypothetical protein